MKNRLLSILILSMLFGNQNTVVNGNIEYFFMNRLSNSDVVNIPFRLLNLNIYHQRDNLDINGEFALEYRPRLDTDFSFDDNPTDFNLVLRDLYVTYYLENGEFSFGKKRYTWGSADENSPIDNISPYDYYYLLNGTQERKLGIYSASFDFYLKNDWKVAGIISPLHNTSRFPIDDPEYPLSLPVSPKEGQFLSVNNPYESGIYLQKSLQNFDFTLSHFRAYDRVFNVSGFAMYSASGGANPQTDIKYSYRLTEANNVGFVGLFNDFTVRSDITFFRSFDRNDIDSFFLSPFWSDFIGGTDYYDIVTAEQGEITSSGSTVGCEESEDSGIFIDCIYPFKEDVRYMQAIFQLELPLPNNYQVNIQYFQYDINEYTNLLTEYYLPDNVQLPNIQIDISNADSEDLFLPGMGAPYSILSKKLTFINLEKLLMDNDLKLSFTLVQDLDEGNGHIFAFESEFDFGSGLVGLVGFNKINGDSSLGDLYRFNSMEDFSSFRTQLTYNF